MSILSSFGAGFTDEKLCVSLALQSNDAWAALLSSLLVFYQMLENLRNSVGRACLPSRLWA